MRLQSDFSCVAKGTPIDKTVRAKTIPPDVRFSMKTEIQLILQKVLNEYMREAQCLSVGHLKIKVTNFWNQRGAIKIELARDPTSDQSRLQLNKSIATFLKAYAKAYDAESSFDPKKNTDQPIFFTDTPERLAYALERMSEKYYPGFLKKIEEPLERVKCLAAQLQMRPGMRLQ